MTLTWFVFCFCLSVFSFWNTYRSSIACRPYLSFKIFMRISLFNFILPLLNHSEWTNENRIELCPPFFFFFFFILMRKCFVLFVFFVAYCLPKTYHKPLPIYIHPPKKKEKERKHQKERHKQRNITITRQSSLIQ